MGQSRLLERHIKQIKRESLVKKHIHTMAREKQNKAVKCGNPFDDPEIARFDEGLQQKNRTKNRKGVQQEHMIGREFVFLHIEGIPRQPRKEQ